MALSTELGLARGVLATLVVLLLCKVGDDGLGDVSEQIKLFIGQCINKTAPHFHKVFRCGSFDRSKSSIGEDYVEPASISRTRLP